MRRRKLVTSYRNSLAVQAFIEGKQQQQIERAEERKLTPQQCKQRAYDAARRKVTLDFARANGLEAAVRQAAEREGCGLSSYTLWLIRLGLERAQRENLTPEKQIARSLKYSYEAIV